MVKGMSVDVCVACGAATLDWTTLERLIGVQPGQLPGGPLPQPLAGAPIPNAPPPPAMSAPAMLDDLPPPQSSQPPQAAPTGSLHSQPPPSVPPASTRNEPGLTGIHFSGPDNAEPGLGSSFDVDDDAFERQLLAAAQARRRRTLLLGGLITAAGVVLLLAISLGYGAFEYVQARNAAIVLNAPAPVPGTDLEDVVPRPDPVPENGTVSVEPENNPEPEPETKPTPPPKPKAPSLRNQLDAGWAKVGSNPKAAASSFQTAIGMNPKHPEANYGYGYALLAQGDILGAKPYLCVAKAGNDIETKRDVTSMLKKHDLTCP